MTPIWFERMVNRWRDKMVMSPHLLGLEQHPGGAPRTRLDPKWHLGYVKHLGGACNLAPGHLWKDLRKTGHWITPAPAHGQQDSEFSGWCRDSGWQMVHCEDVLARHLGGPRPDIRRQEEHLVV